MLKSTLEERAKEDSRYMHNPILERVADVYAMPWLEDATIIKITPRPRMRSTYTPRLTHSKFPLSAIPRNVSG